MKFSCERCGKKYATAEQPVPGRVYKLKCKACGHLVVVRGAVETAATGGAPVAVAQPAAAPGLPPCGEAIAPARMPTSGVPLAGTTELRLPLASEPTQEVVARTRPPVAVTASPAPPPENAFAPPPADPGYVDIFADSPDAARAAAPEGSSDLAAAPEPTAPPADPFLAAARSSLPETFGGPSADPFAPMRAELEAAATGDVPRPDGASRPLATPKFPEIPRPPVQKQGLPIALISAGVLVMVVILGLAVTSVGGKKPPPAAAPQVTAAQPVANPAPAPEPPPPVEPAATAPAPEPKPSRPARVERAAERQHRPERKPDPRPQQVAAAAAEPPPRKEPQVDLPVASEGLSQDQIQKVLVSTRKAFDGCIASAGKDSSRTLDGRKVALRLNIQPNGTVTYPTLDDVDLNATALGSCLKSAARLMVFPKFKGDPLRIEVPLTLSR